MRAPLRGGSQLARFYPRRHLRAGSACAILGASSPNANILLALLFLPRLKLKTDKVFAFCLLVFGFDLFRHVVLQPKRGMKARIRRQGCRRKNGGARMAIAVRSVKAGMTIFGHLRSRLKNGAKPRRRRAALEPSDTDACTILMSGWIY
ncbi:hypothetical protein M993_00013 [Obesumbacterium proteus ATCC 12841]|uniref:Uncharacterized protein n=1 Tax=Obesumbacterium proteus ATCC 12841 TaxID=1354268 RepID=A0AA91EIC4_9GAMM|nr:hypothetical protein M993_00013 [Obesumbacterium proteus ATCC 12841]